MPFIRDSGIDLFAINLEHNSSRKREKVNLSARRLGRLYRKRRRCCEMGSAF
jgi:hypothetical protein